MLIMEKKLYDSLEKVQVSSEWFKVYRLQNNVIAIYEPYHYEEVISYLIIGKEKSLLLDTGMGIDNIKNVVKELTSTDIIVINSHIHCDHVGDNPLFDEVLVYDTEEAMERLKRGYSVDDLKPVAQRKLFEKEPPATFDYENYQILSSNPKPIHDGDIIDLGDRKIEIIHTPGHSQESIMLLDRNNKILFTGDSYYPGPLIAYFNGGLYGYSDISAYAESMEKISKLVPDLDFIHPAHNYPVVEPTVLVEVANAFSLLASGNIAPGKLIEWNKNIAFFPGNEKDIKEYINQNDLYRYEFDRFSIIAKRCHK